MTVPAGKSGSTLPAIKAGASLRGISPSKYGGRLSGFVATNDKTIFGLTLDVVCSKSDRRININEFQVGRLLKMSDDEGLVRPAHSALSLIKIDHSIETTGGYGATQHIHKILSPIEALGKMIQVIRQPHQPSHGAVVGIGHAVYLKSQIDGQEILFFDAIKIEPDIDGSLFSEGGDAGAHWRRQNRCGRGL